MEDLCTINNFWNIFQICSTIKYICIFVCEMRLKLYSILQCQSSEEITKLRLAVVKRNIEMEYKNDSFFCFMRIVYWANFALYVVRVQSDCARI